MVLVSKDAPHSVGMPQHSSAALSQLFSLLFFSFLFFLEVKGLRGYLRSTTALCHSRGCDLFPTCTKWGCSCEHPSPLPFPSPEGLC